MREEAMSISASKLVPEMFLITKNSFRQAFADILVSLYAKN